MFKRKIYNKMIQWKNESNGKTALLIEGPRRVGKSTIVKEFASYGGDISRFVPECFIKDIYAKYGINPDKI